MTAKTKLTIGQSEDNTKSVEASTCWTLSVHYMQNFSERSQNAGNEIYIIFSLLQNSDQITIRDFINLERNKIVAFIAMNNRRTARIFESEICQFSEACTLFFFFENQLEPQRHA